MKGPLNIGRHLVDFFLFERKTLSFMVKSLCVEISQSMGGAMRTFGNFGLEISWN